MNRGLNFVMFNRFILFIILFSLSLETEAQRYHDHIGRDELFIIKVGREVNDSFKISLPEIRSIRIAEKLFGTNYIATRYMNSFNEKPYTGVVFDDGLELYIPDDGEREGKIIFHIRSDKYILSGKNGQKIRVGMTGSDLEYFFPQSWLQKRVRTGISGETEKLVVSVFFTSYSGNTQYIDGSCIEFILTGDGGFIEEFYSYEPG
jgi:hypothetical protein